MTSTVRGTRPVRQRSTRRWIFRRPPRCPWQEPSRDRHPHCPLRRKPRQPEAQSCRLVLNGPSDAFSSNDNHGRTIPLIVPTLGSGFVTEPDALASHSRPIRIKLNLKYSSGLTGRSSELRPRHDPGHAGVALGKLVLIWVCDHLLMTATKSGLHSGGIDPANRVPLMDIHQIVEAIGLGD